MIKSIQAAITSILLLCFGLCGTLVQGQTYSPYTPAQIQEFNSQPLSPAEGPFGPVGSRAVPAISAPSIESRYIKNPDGEEQAEAQSAQSAAPFEPIPVTIPF